MTGDVRITIRAGTVSMDAELLDTETARAVVSCLPITGKVNRWGEEIYFQIPMEMGRDAGARDVVGAGELGYWPDGNAFCIFFGKTPASRGDEIRAASPVNIFGRVVGDAMRFGDVSDGEEIIVTCKGSEATDGG
ncbi:MAG: hypothetical protein JW885_11130 [Deltaproteobacteria bacterium]|nr:hypothetical protein [Candidatus Zymogenaceae bacterium]